MSAPETYPETNRLTVVTDKLFSQPVINVLSSYHCLMLRNSVSYNWSINPMEVTG